MHEPITISPERLAKLTDLVISHGSHKRDRGGDYWRCYHAAKRAAEKDPELLTAIRAPYLSLREEIDAGFIDLVKRMAKMQEAA